MPCTVLHRSGTSATRVVCVEQFDDDGDLGPRTERASCDRFPLVTETTGPLDLSYIRPVTETTLRHAQVIGGGPGGLTAAALLRQACPDAEVVVYERNSQRSTFGFGVVFSAATMRGLAAAAPQVHSELTARAVSWDTVELRLRGEVHRCGGNRMSAIARRDLLDVLESWAVDVGVVVNHSSPIDDIPPGAGLTVVASGANSVFRDRAAEQLEASYTEADARYIWCGTQAPFDGLTFPFVSTDAGVFGAHAYPISEGLSTFIVECDEATWRAAGLDAFDMSQSPGTSDEFSLGVLADAFAEHLGGHPLLGNNSRWGRFRTRRARRWVTGAVAFIGDAVHTAHFSVGSGTKMAMEDAVALAEAVRVCDSVPSALERFQQDRIHQVNRLQQLASTSLDWWEHFGVLHERLAPWQFAVNFFTRSVTVGDLEQRDPAFVEAARAVWRAGSGGEAVLDTPLTTAAGTAIRRVGRFDGTVARMPGVELRDQPPVRIVRDSSAAKRRRGAEQARFDGHVAVLVEPCGPSVDLDDLAETLVLSGRADLVAFEADGHLA